MGSYRCFTHIADHVAVFDLPGILGRDGPFVRDIIGVADHLAVLNPHHTQVAVAFGLDHPYEALETRDDRFAFRSPAGFKKLFHAGQTRCDISTSRHTTGVEGTQGELCTGLADGLGRHNTNGRA